jgi:hypothetical protein
LSKIAQAGQGRAFQITDSRNLFSAILQLLADLRPPPLQHRHVGVNAWVCRSIAAMVQR